MIPAIIRVLFCIRPVCTQTCTKLIKVAYYHFNHSLIFCFTFLSEVRSMSQQLSPLVALNFGANDPQVPLSCVRSFLLSWMQFNRTEMFGIMSNNAIISINKMEVWLCAFRTRYGGKRRQHMSEEYNAQGLRLGQQFMKYRTSEWMCLYVQM